MHNVLFGRPTSEIQGFSSCFLSIYFQQLYLEQFCLSDLDNFCFSFVLLGTFFNNYTICIKTDIGCVTGILS